MYSKKLPLWIPMILWVTRIAMAQIPTDGLVAYFPFDGNANDESGNNFLTSSAGINFGFDRFSNNSSTGTFDSPQDIISATIPAINKRNDWSISLWVKPNSILGTQVLLLNGYNKNCSQNPSPCDANGYGISIVNGLIRLEKLNISAISSNYTISNPNSWTHILITWDQSNNIRFIINGRITRTLVDNYLPIMPTEFIVGRWQYPVPGNTYHNFTGELDEILLYNRAISISEANQIYLNGCSEFFTQTPIVSFSGSTLEVNTYIGANYQWYYNNTSITGANTSVYDGTMSAGTYTVTITNAACQASSEWFFTQDQVLLQNGLRAYYPFNGNANDESGNGWNVESIVGSTLYSNNRFFKSISSFEFNGANKLITSFPGVTGTKSKTVSMWIKPNPSRQNTSQTIVQWGKVNSFGGAARFEINQGGIKGEVGFNISEAAYNFKSHDIDIYDGKWHMITWVIEQNSTTQNAKIYIDKQFLGGGSWSCCNGSHTTLISNVIQEDPLTIGNFYKNIYQAPYYGFTDDIKIYDRALNPSEVSALYSEGCPGFVAEFNYGSVPYCQINFAAPQGTVTGGHFVSQTGLEINTVSGLVNLQASQPGVYNIEYHVPAQYGCTSFSGFAPLTISGVENQTSTINICANGTKTLTGTNAVSWIELGGLGSISDNLFTSNGTAGFATVVGINADGCTSAPIAFEIAPNPVNTTSADAVPVAGTKILSGTGGNIFVHNSGVGSVAENEFSAGLIPGTAQISYINTITGCSTSFTQLVSNGYEIAPVSVNDCSTLPFVIPIQTPVNIGPGVIGLDIELNYNTSIMTPTGVAYLGSVVTTLGEGVVDTYVDGSILHINISYNGAGELSGSGLIVAPEFVLISGTTAAVYTVGGGNVKESYLLYEADVNLNSELFTVLHYLPTFTGHVFHWGNTANPVINNTNTLSGILTATALESCASLGKTSGTDAAGTFSIEMGEGNYGIAISRDIPTDAPVMDVINGFDAVMITRIRNGSLANPTVEQLIAADVNGSGSITSGDRTLLRRRTLMQDTQFPGNVPDWKFYDITTTFSNFNRNSVPAVLTCIPLNSYIEDGCPKMESHSFTGILIGDVDGSYVTDFNEGQNLRTSAEAQVIYDLSAATTDSKGITDLPVRVVYSGTVYSFDAIMEYDDSALSVQSVSLRDEKNSKKSEPVAYNHYKKNLLLATVDNENGFENESYFLSVKAKKLKTELKAADLGIISAYVNGKRVAVIVNEDAANSIKFFGINFVNIYPNPSETGVFMLEFSYSAKVEYLVYNAYGSEVSHGNLSAIASKSELNLSPLPKGVYFLKLTSGMDTVVRKIVID